MNNPRKMTKGHYVNNRRCEKTRKICHESRRQAKMHAKRVKKKGLDKEAYLCTFCRMWHVGRAWQR